VCGASAGIPEQGLLEKCKQWSEIGSKASIGQGGQAEPGRCTSFGGGGRRPCALSDCGIVAGATIRTLV
jgi:hypothetical protein